MSRTPATAARPAGFFALRTPLLPMEILRDFTAGLEARGAWEVGPGLDEALARDRARLAERMLAAVADPVIREALFVASPSLEGDLALLGQAQVNDDRRLKIEIAVSRYLIRMCTRPGPFGLFAGLTTGACGEATALQLPPRGQYRRW